LLADPDSTVIRAYGVLNTEATGQYAGMARPGYFFIGPDGVIREKFFEAKYRDRLSGNNVIGKLFPQLTADITTTVDAPHLQIATEQSDATAFPGGRVTLTAQVRLAPDVHVYSPGAKGYIPIKLTIDPQTEIRLEPAVYPRSKVLYLPAIKERVPVFEGTFRIRQDVEVTSAAAFSGSLGAGGRTVAITGTLDYQACDRTTCYLPTSIPLRWRVQVLPLDRQRAPEAIRHK
jgi:Disulphide bond corrector protein DsbC/AhpC/TSA family